MKTSVNQLSAFQKFLHAGCVLAIAALAVGMFVYVKIDKRINPHLYELYKKPDYD